MPRPNHNTHPLSTLKHSSSKTVTATSKNMQQQPQRTISIPSPQLSLHADAALHSLAADLGQTFGGDSLLDSQPAVAAAALLE